MPRATPARGCQPPTQVTTGTSWLRTSISMAPTNTTAADAVTMETMSSRRRDSGIEIANRAAIRNGPATASGASFSISVA